MIIPQGLYNLTNRAERNFVDGFILALPPE